MGLVTYERIILHGNFEKPRRYKTKDGRPRNSWDRDYKAIVPYRLSWRPKLGKVTCDCIEMVESHMPYYGFTLYHEDRCAVMQHLLRYPQMQNFMYNYDPRVIAQSE